MAPWLKELGISHSTASYRRCLPEVNKISLTYYDRIRWEDHPNVAIWIPSSLSSYPPLLLSAFRNAPLSVSRGNPTSVPPIVPNNGTKCYGLGSCSMRQFWSTKDRMVTLLLRWEPATGVHWAALVPSCLVNRCWQCNLRAWNLGDGRWSMSLPAYRLHSLPLKLLKL